jgi:hypothetical protein
MKRHATVFALLAVLIGLPLFSEEKPIGFVLDLTGRWSINGTALSKGQAVPHGGRIRFSGTVEEAGRASVTIILLNNTSIYINCGTPGACGKDYELPASLAGSESLADRLTEAILKLFGQKPNQYVPALARGAIPECRLQEAVVKLQDRRVMAAPLLAPCRTGRYLLGWKKISNGVVNEVNAFSFEVSWDPARTSEFRADGIQEGLYQISVSPLPRLQNADAAVTSWLLILSGEKYSRAAAEYRGIASAVEKWDSHISLTARLAFLRACLDGLARKYQ